MKFHKYQGAGNDFILFDGRENLPFDLNRHDIIADHCHRRFGIGADGLMVLTIHPDYDFEMHYFNADGYPGSMCGNGGRCIVAFAAALGITPQAGDYYRFIAVDGPHRASLLDNGQVKLEMISVQNIESLTNACVLDTGSPHYVQWVEDVADVEVVSAGRSIRNSERFAEVGINVNFVQEVKPEILLIRTYERGVEDETYACGTGVTAAAIAHVKDRPPGDYTIEVQAKGGNLSVHLHWNGVGASKIWLVGPAEFVFTGELSKN